MSYSPIDILDYVLDKDIEADFLLALSMHKMGYSIGEITDLVLKWKNDELIMKSKTYNINQSVLDEDIMIAAKAGKYISAFISRFNDNYEVHFLVHECMAEDKERYEEEITGRVVQYMILKAIKKLRLDTPLKVDRYIKK